MLNMWEEPPPPLNDIWCMELHINYHNFKLLQVFFFTIYEYIE